MSDEGEKRIASGDLIDGKYRIVRLLGEGGSARVYEAENTWIQLRVAIKVLRTGAVADVATIERFKGEAQVAARVAHPHIAAVFDLGRDPRTGALFMVQELLRGNNLRARLREAGRLSVSEALSVVIPVGEALRAAHARGFVHRDLKPENIVLTRDDEGRVTPKLIDFGVARRAGEGRVSAPDAIIGTVGYMAPEQARGVSDLDARVDVWALGAVLFEALAGRGPYPPVPHEAKLFQLLSSHPDSLSSVAPDLPPQLCAAVDRALSHDRDARFESMGSLVEALRTSLPDASIRPVASLRPQRPRVLLVDDDDLLRATITRTLWKYDVESAADGARALELLRGPTRFDLVLTDLSMPKVNGLEVVRAAAGLNVPAIMISGTATVDTAVEAMRLGAVNFISKPFRGEALTAAITDVFAARQVTRAAREELIGDAPSLRGVLELATLVADTDATALLTGETGVGKEVLARLIHRLSARAERPFVTVDVASLTDATFDAELFGVPGGRVGLLTEADGGTLFFDEVGDMPLACQSRILRLVQERSWQPAGESRPRKADVRILASTRHDLSARIARESFRADLYYRLSVVTLHTPPLRERQSDIPALVDRFISDAAEEHRRAVKGIAPEALSALCAWPWPGNVRELRNAITRMVITHRGGALTAANLPPEIAGHATRAETAPPVDRNAERERARHEAERLGEAMRPRKSTLPTAPLREP